MEERFVEVTNREDSKVGYYIPDSNVTRTFSPGETKKQIPLSELQQLQYVPGGDFLLEHYLMIKDKNALSVLNIEAEEEYFYTKEDVEKLLFEGTLDQLDDALTFAPQGVVSLIQDCAVELNIPDMRKRNLITEKTGFNIDNAIRVNQIMNQDATEENKEQKEKVHQRKAVPMNASTNIPNYKVVGEYGRF